MSHGPAHDPGGPTRDPAGALLRGGAGPGLAALLVAALVMLVLDGGAAAVSAAVGGVLAVLALAVGPLVMRAAGRLTPSGLQAVAVGSYFAVVVVLGVVWVLLGAVEEFDDTAAAVGVLAAAGAWVVGQAVRTRRLRTPVFSDTELPR
ncbi:hypothetical protein ACIB24_21590 [Spongisporangium articulatum]|uniref:Uncharacterized protein n=1 Tax=Spongisporangium articulatum TaxID=3362603 RepID=A0ABW8ATG7_9ACTN